MPNKKRAAPARAALHKSSPCNISYKRTDFQAINRAALQVWLALLTRWLPSGRKIGHDWVALNPRRLDRHIGSFRIDLRNGKWIDHATNDKGSDPISLAAYLGNIRQIDAAIQLAQMLGVANG